MDATCAAYYQNFADHRINSLIYRETGMYECSPIIATLSDKNDSVTLYTARFDELAEKLLAMGFRQLRLPTPYEPSSGGLLHGCSHS